MTAIVSPIWNVGRWAAARAAASWLVAAVLSLSPTGRAAGADPGPALGRKEFLAAVLAKVPPYVRWPQAAFRRADDPFVIGLLGEDPTEGLLGALVQGMRVDGREVVVKTFPTPGEVTPCQIMFVPAGRVAEWETISKQPGMPHVLAVGETEDFEKQGGVLVASYTDRRLHLFMANTRKAQLEVDARLLKIAKVHR